MAATCWVSRSFNVKIYIPMFDSRRLQLSALLSGPLFPLMSFCAQSTSSYLSEPVFFFGNVIIKVKTGVVEELLGADLMEHNILHKGIGVTETLDTLARFKLVICSNRRSITKVSKQ